MLRAKLITIAAPAASGSGYEISFHSDPYILDGRYGNNAWLQETPRPITKLTWDNAIVVSEKTAKALDVTDEDRVAVDYNGHTVWGAIWRVAGQPDGAIALSLGYGRRRAGRAANGAGFDVYPLRNAGSPYYATGATVRKLNEKFRLAATQHHFTMEGRDPVRVATLDELEAGSVRR